MNLFYKNKLLCFVDESLSLNNLAVKLNGPTYVYHQQLINRRLAQYHKTLIQNLGEEQKYMIHIAIKANSYSPLITGLRAPYTGIDAVSGAEITQAIKCGFKPSEIIFSGVGKSAVEIEHAVRLQIKQINVESLSELIRIEKICRAINQKASVALRINPEFEIETHPYIKTGSFDSKFGIIQSHLIEASQLIAKSNHLDFKGINFHLGSQLMEPAFIRDICRLSKTWIQKLAESGSMVTRLDLGGGLGIDYKSQDLLIDEKRLAEYFSIIKSELPLSQMELLFEPGRWLFARGGVLLAQIEYVKRGPRRNFLVVNTGIHHLIRPALYNAHHTILPLNENAGPEEKFDVVGPLCESSDVLGREISWINPQEGDWLAIADAGAYGFELASKYNLQELPERLMWV